MIVTNIKKEEDILLRLNELSMESDREFNTEQDVLHQHLDARHRIEEENQQDLHGDELHSRYDIKEDEDILLRLKELAMESDREFKKEQDDRSLAKKERDHGFKAKIEEENQKILHEDASHYRFDIREDEDILLRLNDLTMEVYPEFKKEQDDRSLADKESDGGFKLKIEEEISEDASHSRYDIKEDEDILLRLNESAMESDPESKEQDDRSLAEKKSDEGFKLKIEEAYQKDLLLHEDGSHSRYDTNDDDILHRLNESFMEPVREFLNAADKLKKEENDLHGDLNGGQGLVEEESDGGFKQQIEENTSNSQHEIKKALINEDLEESNSSEKDGPFDGLEKIVLKFYGFIDHTFEILKDAQKLKLNVQDKFEFLEKVQYLLLTSPQRVDMAINELERMKKEESSARKTQIPEILIQVIEINAFLIERSFHQGITILFNENCTEKELACCINELNQTKENLGIILWRIRELKSEKMEKEDGDATEEPEKFSGCGDDVPQLPDGFER